MIDPNYPNPEQFDVKEYDNRKGFYPDVEEMIPDTKDMPEPKGPKIRITVYKHADHVHDMLTRRSISEILLL